MAKSYTLIVFNRYDVGQSEITPITSKEKTLRKAFVEALTAKLEMSAEEVEEFLEEEVDVLGSERHGKIGFDQEERSFLLFENKVAG